MSYLSGIYVILIWGRDVGNIEKKKKNRKQIEKNIKKFREKKAKNTGKTNNNNKHLWFNFYIKKIYFARKHSLKKTTSYHHILLADFMHCRVFETQ